MKGCWPASYDRLWQQLVQLQGKQQGTQQMIDLLKVARQQGYGRLEEAVSLALSMECWDPSAIRFLMAKETLQAQRPDLLRVGVSARYER